MPLTQKQRRHLRRLAHQLKPIVIIGQRGLTEGVLTEVDSGLRAHELIKVKINSGDRENRRRMLEAICGTLDAESIQAIGHTITLYRRHPNNPRIALPDL